MQIPFVYKDGKVFFYHTPNEGETQEYCDNSVLIHGVDADKYTYADGVVTPVSQEVADQLDTASQAVLDAEAVRVSEIEVLKETSGLKKVSADVARAYIEAQFNTDDLVATLPALQAATDLNSAMTAIIASLTEIKILFDKAKETNLAEVPYLIE